MVMDLSEKLMRKITQKAVNALYKQYPFKQDNTEVRCVDGIWCMYLHGSRIAQIKPTGLEINNCGYLSNTTKERLNALPEVSIIQKHYIWYLNGSEMKDGWNVII